MRLAALPVARRPTFDRHFTYHSRTLAANAELF